MGIDEKLLNPDPLVRELEELGETAVAISGYVGSTEDKEKIKVWSTLELNDYVEVARDDICSVEKHSIDERRVTLRVRGTADVRHVSTRTATAAVETRWPLEVDFAWPWSIFRPQLPINHCDVEFTRCMAPVIELQDRIATAPPEAVSAMSAVANQMADQCRRQRDDCEAGLQQPSAWLQFLQWYFRDRYGSYFQVQR